MKSVLFLALSVFMFVSCRKSALNYEQSYIDKIQISLKDSLSSSVYKALDFQNAIHTKVDSVGLYLLRIPLADNKSSEDFVLLQLNKQGYIQKGRIIHMEGEISKTEIGGLKYNGSIVIKSLNGEEIISSAIKNGFIIAFNQNANQKTALVQPSNILPEVIITYTIKDDASFSWSAWASFINFFQTSGAYENSGGSYYSSLDGGSNYYGGGGSTGINSNYSTGGGPIIEPPILVDFENYLDKEQIDIQQFVNCFNAIPDAGSTCSIEISTDIPVDTDPNAFYNFSTGSPGHAFITIKKSNGSLQVTQNIGFYPKSDYKAVTYAPTAGKLVDNAGHEFNASLFMALTPAQLSTVLMRVQQLSNLNYDVDEYNCTDWALDIFNRTRSVPLQIPLYGLPGSPLTQQTRTPQGLYHKLQQMSNANDPEKGNITIGIIKGYAGSSTGPCK